MSGGNKYHARRTLWAGEVYDSAGEARYAQHLALLQAAGHIRSWCRGRRWELVPGLTLQPDFEVVDQAGQLRAVDFKGVVTEPFRIKARVWAAVYPDVPLVVVTADGSERRVA
jgi:hypothetical protein